MRRSPPEFRAVAGLITLSTAMAGAGVAKAQDASLLGRLDAPAALVAHQAVQAALEFRAAGDSEVWEVRGVARGAVTPRRTWQSTTGHWCREFEERVRLENGESEFRVAVRCRSQDGRWKPLKG